jgi:hypothetical protein
MNRRTDYQARVESQRRPALERTGGGLDLGELVRLGTLAASSHNTQPWRFRLCERAIEVLPDFRRRCPVVDPDDAHLFKSLGCAAENLVQGAAAQGHAARVAFDSESQSVRVRFEPSAAQRPGPLSRALARRQCTRLRYDARPLAAEARPILEAAGQVGQARIMFVEHPARRDSIIDYVRAGDLAQLTDRAFRNELIAWLRFNDADALATGDGLAGKTSGQPPLPAWLARPLLRFLLTGQSQADRDTASIRSSSMLAAVVTATDTPSAWIDAGRAYERLALQATALGIRNAFINQPVEVPALRGPLQRALGLDGEVVQLLLRLGSGPEAPFSLRRPMEDVIERDSVEPDLTQTHRCLGTG